MSAELLDEAAKGSDMEPIRFAGIGARTDPHVELRSLRRARYGASPRSTRRMAELRSVENAVSAGTASRDTVSMLDVYRAAYALIDHCGPVEARERMHRSEIARRLARDIAGAIVRWRIRMAIEDISGLSTSPED